MKKLVVYYSYEGTTKYLAEELAKEVEADLLVLEPVTEKKTVGFMKFVWGGYQAVMKKKPDLKPYDTKVNDYDIIILGTPVWAGTYSPPIRSFLGQEALLEKKIAYFYTNNGGATKVEVQMNEALRKNHLLGAKGVLTNQQTQEENSSILKEWMNSIIG